MRIYKASGIAPLPGVFIALIAGLIAALIMGGVLYAVDHYLTSTASGCDFCKRVLDSNFYQKAIEGSSHEQVFSA